MRSNLIPQTTNRFACPTPGCDFHTDQPTLVHRVGHICPAARGKVVRSNLVTLAMSA